MSIVTATRAAARERVPAPRLAALYVVAVLWGLPLLGFTVAAVRADATPCLATDGLPCNEQDTVVATGVLTAVLLIPVGLIALLVVALLARSTTRPAGVAAVASGIGLAVGGAAVAVGYLILG